MTIANDPAEKSKLFLFIFALAKFGLHMATASGYGYFRDEFYYLACTEHLAFGYVDQPALSIFLLWVQRSVLGDSLHALRFLPAVAGAGLVFTTGLIVREIGGGRIAQILAMMAALAAPEYLALNHFYSMNSFELLFWALAFYQLLRVLRLQTTLEWVVLGVLLGLGLMNKISVLWLGAGIFAGLVLTSYRKLLATPGPWIAGVIAGFFFLPYVLWNLQNDKATLEFMRNATAYKMLGSTAVEFFVDQMFNMNIVSAPLWLCGLVFCFTYRHDPRVRILGWIYLSVVAILLASPAARSGYLAPSYPPLFAMGGLALERWLAQSRARALLYVYAFLILAAGAVFLPFAVPVLPVESYIAYARKMGEEPSTEERKEVGPLPQFYADMFGWREITKQVADVYHSLPPEEQKKARVFGNNYGHTGAIAFFGSEYSLPPPISSHNNYWIWGPGDYSGEVLIIVGGSAETKREIFEDVQEAGRTSCQYCMPYENNRIIFVCRRMKRPVAEVWQRVKHYD